MYLLDLDESGSDDSDYFVVGGFAVHEQDAWPLAVAADRLASALPGQARDAEFHASPMRRGGGVWRNVSQDRRVELIGEIGQLLAHGTPALERRPVLFATAIHRASFPHIDPQERAYEEFFARANGFLGRLASTGDRHRCIAISDKSHLENRLQRLMPAWRTSGASSGARIGPMQAYAEVPVFVDSQASRLIQLADFVAHWVYRAYEHDDWSMLDILLPAFDQSDGVRHGLVHLTEGYRDCNCPACRSRRP